MRRLVGWLAILVGLALAFAGLFPSAVGRIVPRGWLNFPRRYHYYYLTEPPSNWPQLALIGGAALVVFGPMMARLAAPRNPKFRGDGSFTMLLGLGSMVYGACNIVTLLQLFPRNAVVVESETYSYIVPTGWPNDAVFVIAGTVVAAAGVIRLRPREDAKP